jgi:hypothetical protein
MPWFSIHDNDPESLLLADLSRAIRSDRSFWPEFTSRIDALLKQNEICQRESNGFLHFFRDDIPPAEYFQKNAEFWDQMAAEGFQDGAVSALKRTGYEAWINSVGHIAIHPPASTLP